MVENFGSYLKHERELRGVPLQEIADNTKIPMRFLQALENNNLDELPGEVFIKGYIRSYAKSIGTNEDEILLAFDASAGEARKEKKRHQSEKATRVLSARRTKYRKALYWVLAGLLVLMVAERMTRLSNEVPEPTNRTVTTLNTPDSKPSKPKPSKPKPLPSDVLIIEKKETVIPPTESPAAVESPSETTPEAAGETVSQKEFEPAVSPPPEPSTPAPGTNLEEEAVPGKPEKSATVEPLSETTPEAAGETASPKEFEPSVSPPPEPSTPAPGTNLEEEAEPGEPEKSMELIRKDDIIPPTQKSPSANVAQPLELTIQVEEQSWFELLIDGTRTEDFILPEGTGKTFQGETSFKITIGNRNGTQLSLNGKLLVLPPSSEKEKDVVRDFLIQANPLE